MIRTWKGAIRSLKRHPLPVSPYALAFWVKTVARARAEVRFKEWVRQLWKHGIYPGPTMLNLAVHGRQSRNLNGREAKWRRQTMRRLRIPLQRPNGSRAARLQMTGKPR